MSSQDDMSGNGAKSSFQSQAAEGDIMAKQGEYKKAIESYTKVWPFADEGAGAGVINDLVLI